MVLSNGSAGAAAGAAAGAGSGGKQAVSTSDKERSFVGTLPAMKCLIRKEKPMRESVFKTKIKRLAGNLF